MVSGIKVPCFTHISWYMKGFSPPKKDNNNRIVLRDADVGGEIALVSGSSGVGPITLTSSFHDCREVRGCSRAQHPSNGRSINSKPLASPKHGSKASLATSNTVTFNPNPGY